MAKTDKESANAEVETIDTVASVVEEVDDEFNPPRVITIVGVLNKIIEPNMDYNQKAWRYHVTALYKGRTRTLELLSFRTSQLDVEKRESYEFKVEIHIAGKTEYVDKNGEIWLHKTDAYILIDAIGASRELTMMQLQQGLSQKQNQEGE